MAITKSFLSRFFASSPPSDHSSVLSSVGPFGHFYVFPFICFILARSHATIRPLHTRAHYAHTYTHIILRSDTRSIVTHCVAPHNAYPQRWTFFVALLNSQPRQAVRKEGRKECVALCELDLCVSARARRTAPCVRRTAKGSE